MENQNISKSENLTKTSVIKNKINYWKYTTILFVVLFLGGLIFFISNNKIAQTLLSKNVEQSKTENLNPKTSKIPTTNENTENSTISLDKIGQYIKTGQTVSYKCFEEADKTDDVDFTAIKQEVSKENRALNQACIFGDKAIVASVKKVREMWNEPYGMQIHIYTHSENNWYYGEALFTSTDQEMTRFKLIDWTTSNDILYALFDGKMIGVRRFLTGVYHTNLERDFESPILIESCEYGIAGGTSERGFVKCVGFSQKDKSSYIKQSDLP